MKSTSEGNGGPYRAYLMSRLAEVERLEKQLEDTERRLVQVGADSEKNNQINRQSLRDLRKQLEAQLKEME